MEIKEITLQGINSVTPQDWRKAVQHVRGVIYEAIKQEIPLDVDRQFDYIFRRTIWFIFRF